MEIYLIRLVSKSCLDVDTNSDMYGDILAAPDVGIHEELAKYYFMQLASGLVSVIPFSI